MKNGFEQEITSDSGFNFENWEKGYQIENELDLERAMSIERKLRLLSKEDSSISPIHKRLSDAIYQYEQQHWSKPENISDAQVRQSDLAQAAVEEEELFLFKRRERIRLQLKELLLTQQDLGEILGHNSKTYMSELMNGIYPFSLKDLVIIHKLLKIPLNELVPLFLSESELLAVNTNVQRIKTKKIKSRVQPLEWI